MERKEYPAINVINAIRGFPTQKLKLKVTPYRFQLPDGRSFVVRKIRRMTSQQVGHFTHYHFVVQTREERYFHLVLDTSTLVWRLVQEVDEELFFHE